MGFVRRHSATLALLGVSVAFGLVTGISGYHYWMIEGPKAHGDFWTWFLHHATIEMFGEVLIGGLLLLHITKLREAGSPETGDEDQ